MTPLSRRRLLQSAGALALGLGAGCAGPGVPVRRLKRMIVLGVDGMDPVLVRQFVSEGRMPHCKRLMELGSVHDLGTSNPPQSPVAWSSFISGTNPGGHGIFDFVARDPKTMQPYQSTARAEGGGGIRLGKVVLPTRAGQIRNLRKGPTFWQDLERHGVDCTVFRIPANFPTAEGDGTALSGMGTPDLQGGYGTFTFFTDDPQSRTRDVSGGRIERLRFRDHTAKASLRGPANEFSADREQVEIPLTISRDPERPVVQIEFPDRTVILKEGEWSEWVPVRFPLLGSAVDAAGICRVYLKKVRDSFGLYVSPVNIDPLHPSVPISTPPEYSRQLARELGYYYTQGMVEDTHALSAGVLDSKEYRQHAEFVHEERLRFYERELSRFEKGFLFFYFSTLDLSSHVFWRAIDPRHPLYTAELHRTQGDFIADLYGKIDKAIGRAMEKLDDDTWLLVLSDHGFTSFRRQFHLNSWLLDNGYLKTNRPPVRAGSSAFQDVAWSKSRAYGLGINSLYLNLKGRERDGAVSAGEVEGLTRELIQGLEAVRDPANGEKVISHVWRAAEIYSGPYVHEAPDLIVGYNRGYRASWETILGGFPREHVVDNTDAWSGDHCIDPALVPGILLSSRPLRAKSPRLEDLAPTILKAFQVPVPKGMTGNMLLQE